MWTVDYPLAYSQNVMKDPANRTMHFNDTDVIILMGVGTTHCSQNPETAAFTRMMLSSKRGLVVFTFLIFKQ